mmetsp:Transcript_27272/g.70715  ORF Transcript_27272/g.70715 Transcript_27272/m.70715 type:complete len:577 (+) Transcript_27272:74-1804(+)
MHRKWPLWGRAVLSSCPSSELCDLSVLEAVNHTSASYVAFLHDLKTAVDGESHRRVIDSVEACVLSWAEVSVSQACCNPGQHHASVELARHYGAVCWNLGRMEVDPGDGHLWHSSFAEPCDSCQVQLPTLFRNKEVHKPLTRVGFFQTAEAALNVLVVPAVRSLLDLTWRRFSQVVAAHSSVASMCESAGVHLVKTTLDGLDLSISSLRLVADLATHPIQSDDVTIPKCHAATSTDAFWGRWGLQQTRVFLLVVTVPSEVPHSAVVHTLDMISDLRKGWHHQVGRILDVVFVEPMFRQHLAYISRKTAEWPRAEGKVHVVWLPYFGIEEEDTQVMFRRLLIIRMAAGPHGVAAHFQVPFVDAPIPLEHNLSVEHHPSEPGCHFRMPDGCPMHPEDYPGHVEWSFDRIGADAFQAHVNSFACLETRAEMFRVWCGAPVEMYFQRPALSHNSFPDLQLSGECFDVHQSCPGISFMDLDQLNWARSWSQYIPFGSRSEGQPGCPFRSWSPDPGRFLVWACDPTARCGGQSDRVKGIVSAFLLAVATNRTFLVDSSDPFPMQWFFCAKVSRLASAVQSRC